MRAFIITLIFASICSVLTAQKTTRYIDKGNADYRQKQFTRAKASYGKALQQDNTNAVAQFNSGNASQQLKQYEEASKSYEAAATTSNDPLVKAQAFYNQGLSFIRQKKITDAITAFKKSLRLNPNDNDTRENLQKALKELQQQQSKNDDKQKDKNKKKPEDKKQPQPQNTKLSKEQADKMLNDLQKEEKNLQKQVQKKNQSARQLKDW